MSITRINEFRAHEGQGDALRERLESFIPTIAASDGCQSCQLLQSQADPAHLVVIEVWDSIEAHQASVRNIPAGAVEDTMKLLAGSPKGEYYHS